MKSWRWMCVILSSLFVLAGCSSEGGESDPVCGNGTVEEGEQCDGTDLASTTCASLGYDEGELGCQANCVFNLTNCRGGNPCGNGIVDTGEDCDGADLNGETCLSLDWGFNGGSLACGDSCLFDTSACVAEVCGDGTIGPGEDCDSGDLGGATCESLNYDGGVLACNDWSCTFDLNGCEGNPCGNGSVDYGEECDGSDLNGETCESQGFSGGILACAEGCYFDWEQCVPWCGNGVIDANLGEDCDGTNLDGKGCADLGYDGGTLSCDDYWCEFNTAECTGEPCGNGVVDYGEDCDGTDLGGETCASQGFESGSLACQEYCFFDTSGCISFCGNGNIDEGEECDGTNLDGQSCQCLGYPGGELGCTSYCYFDTWTCDSKCGNGVVDEDEWEECDGSDLNGATCLDLGYAGGTLVCTEECYFDYSQCIEACGNGAIDPNEDCDGTNLNGQTCEGLGFAGGSLACGSYCGFDTRNCTCAGDDQYEPNGNQDSAAPIQPGTLSGLLLCSQGDEDWYQVTLNAKTIYALDVTFLHAEGDVDVYLYQAGSDSSVASGTSTTDNENLAHGVSTANAGTYYIKVIRYSAPTVSQTYGLSVSVQQQVDCIDASDCAAGLVCSGNQCGEPAQGDVCQNPITISALPFTASGVDIAQFGSDFTFGNSDCTGYGLDGRDAFYRLEMSAGQAISVVVTSDFDAALYLIPDCSATTCLVGADAAVSNGTETVEYTASSAGPVTIVVDHYLSGGPTSGSFDISVSGM